MRRIFLWVWPLLVLAGCGPADPHEARFQGTWQHIVENNLTNAKDDSTITISADHDRFRISEKIGNSESIEVFDGQTLYTKTVFQPVDSSEGESMPPTSRAQPMTATQTGSRRFWSSTYTSGHADAGGLVAGQDTLLYKISEHRLDGDLSEQQWVDAKTGILLKSISAIYSSQVQSLVRQETWECRSINYAGPPETDFQKP